MPPRLLLIALLPLGYLLIPLLSAGLLAYPLHLLLHDAMSLRAVVSRGTLALIVLSLPWLIRRLRLTAHELGLAAPTALKLKNLMIGLTAGAGIMGLLVLMEAAWGLRVGIWPPGEFAAAWLRASAKPLLVGVLVGCVEELLFRGVLLGALLRYRRPFYAVTVSAFYYAALHFYHSELKLPPDSLHWGSGLLVVRDGFAHLLRWSHLDSFAALFFAGILLGCLRLLLRCGLLLCIGVHIAWVYTLRTTLALTDLAPTTPWRFLVGDYDHIIGWLAAVWLALLCLPLLLIVRRRSMSRGLP